LSFSQIVIDVFIGYNFPSLEAITPYLEPTTSGISTRWAITVAQQYECHVTVGYPEISVSGKDSKNKEPKRYNSTVTVSPSGKVISNYRKTFLYYTDETWASEGDVHFFNGSLGALGEVSHGICMDINPYRFLADWTAYEFANAALEAGSPLIVLSMAWITRLEPAELSKTPSDPDVETQTYWLERMRPILTSEPRQPVVLVFANRCGQEGGVCYAGSSMIVRVGPGKEIAIYDRLGRAEEKVLVVDLDEV
jgi:protein N-terminal amidase